MPTYQPIVRNASQGNVVRSRTFLKVLRDRARELGYRDPVCRDCVSFCAPPGQAMGVCVQRGDQQQLDLGVCELWEPDGPLQLELPRAHA